jgi:Co/Zn/Cd efflux system component
MMEAAPENINVPNLKQELLAIPNVKGIHCLHVWNLSGGKPALTVHLVSEECTETLILAHKICEKKGITHNTIQVENCCDR